MYSAGTAYLTIVPSFKGVERALREQLAKAGADADKSISGGIGNSTGDAISKQIARGLSGNGARARKAGEDDGKRYAGSLGDTIQKQLAAGHKALPEETSGPHTDQVRLTELRKDLESLKDFHIKGDVDDAQALLDIEGLKARIDELKAETKDIPLKLDLEESSRELEKALGRFNSFAEKGGEDAGDKFGGAFAESWRSHLNDAADSLPTIELDADSTPADVKIAELKARLAELSGKTIGVDFDDGKALAEIRELLVELDKVARSDPRISARADIAAAYGELLALDGLAKRLDGKKINLKALTDSGSATNDINVGISRMGVLIGLGVSLGPAIVPAAAAAAAAIGGIATAALGAGSGIGVLLLGFSGISGAVQALGKSQQKADDSGQKLLGTNTGVASSANAIRSAERSLADARTNAAYSAERSSQSIVKSQRDVADAEKEVLKAQEDLTAAEEKARQEDEDRTLSLRENATAQKEALLDIQDSKKALDTLLANPRASEEEKQRAQDAYDQRVEQYDGLVIQGKRLQTEQDKSFKAGIAGNAEVKNAQDQVEKSVRAVADAQQSLANTIEDGQRQQHQSAEAIISAQEQLAQAQQTTGSSAVQASRSATTAMNNLQTAMDALSPAGQRFARFIFGLKGDFTQLRDSASEGLLPKFQQAIIMLLPYLPGVSGFIGKIADTLGNIAIDVVKSFGNPAWQRFFGFIDQTAAPTLVGMETVVENVTNGLTDLLLALSPFNKQMGSGLVALTADFANWSAKLSSTKGYREFIDYVRQNSGAVIHMLGNLSDTIGHIVVAAAPVGAVVVRGISALSAAINLIPTWALVALLTVIASATAVILPLVGALKLYKFTVDLVAGSQKLWNEITVVSAAVQGKLSTALTGLQTIFGKTVVSTNAATTSMNAAQGGATALTRTLSISMVAGIGLLLGSLALLWEGWHQNKQEVSEASDDLQTLGGDYARTGAVSDEALQGMAKNSPAMRELTKALKEQGLTVDDLGKSYQGNADLQRKMLDAAKAHYDLINQQIANFNPTKKANGFNTDESTKAFNQLIDDQKAAREAVDALKKSYTDAKVYADAYTAATEASAAADADKAKASQDLAANITTLQHSYDVLTGKIGGAADRAAVFKTMLDEATQSSINANEAVENQADSNARLTDSLKANGSEFDLTAAKTAAQTEKVLANRDALEAALTASRDKAVEDVAAGMAITGATKANNDRIAGILQEIPANQRDTTAVQDLVTWYGKIPPNISTDVKITGADEVLRQLQENQIAQYALDHNVSIAEARATEAGQLSVLHSQVPSAALKNATGGHIRGPGTSTSDSIPSWLSDNEFVHQASAVDYYGVAAMHALNQKLIPREAIAGFAVGGLVHWPVNVDASKAFIPPVRPLIGSQVVYPTGTASLGISSTGVSNIQQFIRSTDPLPYVWAAAGPNGYDCSGLVSAVYGLYTGRGGGKGQRYFTTFDFANSAPSGFKPGLGGMLDIGVNPNTHMAGVFGGLGFEAKSTAKGIVVGRGTTPPGAFQKQFHMATGGLISIDEARQLGYDIGGDPSGVTVNGRTVPFEVLGNIIGAAFPDRPKVYDSGGQLPPGLSTVFNGTGRPEPVLTAPQLDALVQAANGGGGHVENHYHMEFADTTLTPEKFRAMQDRDAVLARQGRAR